jgi:hypothetical protein
MGRPYTAPSFKVRGDVAGVGRLAEEAGESKHRMSEEPADRGKERGA